MAFEEITPQTRAEYDRQLKESAEKGWKYVKIIAYANIGIAVLGLLTGNHGILSTVISLIISIFLLKGSTISRILFLLGSAFSLIIEILLGLGAASIVLLTGISLKAVAVGALLMIELAADGAILYFLFFNKNVDSFFKYLRNKKYGR